MEENQIKTAVAGEETVKFNDFSSVELVHFQDEMASHNWALRAFGALLESADLGRKFGNEWTDAEDFRHGLNMIVEMYIEKQEQKINELDLKFRNSPEHILKDALRTYENIRQGLLGCTDYALEQVKSSLKKVNLVISELGTEDYPQALKIRDNLTHLAGFITERLRNKNMDLVEKFKD